MSWITKSTKRQSANFLSAIPRDSGYLSAVVVMTTTGCFFLLLLLLTISFQLDFLFQKKKLTHLHQQYLSATTAFQLTSKNYPFLVNGTPLLKQIQALEHQIKEKKKTFKLITHRIIRRPFSDYMIALSRCTPDGVWLKEINIDQDKNDISLLGYALKPVDVSTFLQSLVSSKIFADTDFNLFSVKKLTKNGTDYIKFEITNNQLADPDKSDEKK